MTIHCKGGGEIQTEHTGRVLRDLLCVSLEHCSVGWLREKALKRMFETRAGRKAFSP